MRRTSRRLLLLLVCLSVAYTAPKAAQESTKNESVPGSAETIWRDPGDMSSLNLVYGAGGKADAPDPEGTYTFVKEDAAGTNPKFDVTDQAGTQWRVKLGEESRAETAASRLVWAAGYFVDEDYYLPTLKITGLPALRRGQALVSAGGIVHEAELERHNKHEKKLGNWDWFHNPFAGTRELNGLRLMMALLNNWDLKAVNNSIYEVDNERRFLVSDLGATLGNSGNYFTRSKSSIDSYTQTKFIRHVDGDSVAFVMHTRPFLLTAVRVNYYRDNAHMEDVVRHIPKTDARWIGERLSKLSEEQTRDVFQAAGYPAGDVERFTRTIQARIAELNSL
jgi:hypothetical protein